MSAIVNLPSSRRGPPDLRPPRDGQTSWGPDSVETEITQNRALTTAASRTRVKGWAEEIIRRDEGRAGGRLLAYDNLGRSIGRSRTWVRRLLGGEAVGLAHETFERMREAYLRHCARIEAEAEAARRRAALLRLQSDAIEAQLARSTRTDA